MYNVHVPVQIPIIGAYLYCLQPNAKYLQSALLHACTYMYVVHYNILQVLYNSSPVTRTLHRVQCDVRSASQIIYNCKQTTTNTKCTITCTFVAAMVYITCSTMTQRQIHGLELTVCRTFVLYRSISVDISL